jgi:hypothetical protein
LGELAERGMVTDPTKMGITEIRCKARIGLIWLRTETSGGLLSTL